MEKNSQFALLGQRRFAPFFWTQFLGAFNDNVFKTALLTIITYDALSWTTADVGLLNNLIPGLFILPFLLFSATAGQLADKYEKSGLTRFVKLLEIAIMLVAAAGWMTHNLWLLVAAVVGMGLHSTLFGPVKYAYLPQQLRADELVGGNGVIEMGTFVGILLGEVLGAVLVVYKPWGVQLVAGGTIAIAVLGWLTSRGVPLTLAAAPGLRINWNPLTETVRNLRHTRRNRIVYLAVLGNSWFWFYGAILLAQFPVYAKNYLHGDHGVFVLLLTVFSLGIGAGSLLCERLSGHKVEIGLVPFGAIGLSVFGLDLFLASLAYANTETVGMRGFVAAAGSWRILLDCVFIGVFGGFYIVPLFALIQTRSDPAHLSRTIAGMNIMNALFMVTAALVAMLLLGLGLSIPQLFMVTALMNAVVTIAIFLLMPEFLVRFIGWVLVHTLYRVQTVDAGRIPAAGQAVLVCKHVSHMDALVIAAACPRPVRFVMDQRTFRIPVVSWLFRAAGAIPMVPPAQHAGRSGQAYDQVAAALEGGALVCIFADGEIGDFLRGVQHIVGRTPAPVIPIALRGMWSRLLARSDGNPYGRSYAHGPRSRLWLSVGAPLAPAQVTADALRSDWK